MLNLLTVLFVLAGAKGCRTGDAIVLVWTNIGIDLGGSRCGGTRLEINTEARLN